MPGFRAVESLSSANRAVPRYVVLLSENGPLRFSVDVGRPPSHVLDLLWGAKNDERTAELS